MKSNYSVFINRLIDKYEGGYGWDKGDRGGPTKYGITCFRLAEHRGQKMDSMERWAPIVQALTRAEAETIYAKYYAIPCKFDTLPSGVDCCVLDYGVNSGPGRANSVLAAIYRAHGDKVDAHKLIDLMCDERLAFMKRINGGKDWERFGKGWGSRVADLRKYCHALVDGKKTKPAVDLSTTSTPKAEPVKSDPVGTVLNGTAGSSATGAGAKAIGVPTVVVVVIIAAGVAAAIAYAINKHRKAKKEAAIILP